VISTTPLEQHTNPIAFDPSSLQQGIDVFWLLNIHIGRFGSINLQSASPVLLVSLTLVLTVSGLSAAER
tara:strand:- start:409 stop:615 length:207 start_codon:yes stop_codon:yes gene_type:complete